MRLWVSRIPKFSHTYSNRSLVHRAQRIESMKVLICHSAGGMLALDIADILSGRMENWRERPPSCIRVPYTHMISFTGSADIAVTGR